MSMIRMTCLSLLLAAGSAFAHPGHGKPGFLHTHTWAQLADWLANGALLLVVVFLLFSVGLTVRKIMTAMSRRRK
jgi:hypothetical protein